MTASGSNVFSEEALGACVHRPLCGSCAASVRFVCLSLFVAPLSLSFVFRKEKQNKITCVPKDTTHGIGIEKINGPHEICYVVKSWMLMLS